MKYVVLFILMMVPVRLQSQQVIFTAAINLVPIADLVAIDRINKVEEVHQIIREHEGLMLKKYYCPGGMPTIGYGHVINKHELYSKITVEQADSLLVHDFRKAFMIANSRYPNLDFQKQLVAAHFIYATGIPGPGLDRLFKEGKDPWPVLSRYIHIRGEPSKYLLGIRKKEYELWKRNQ